MDTQNYFDLFDLPHKVELDTEALQASYIKLQSELHPDRFMNKPKEEQQMAVIKSSMVNSAYVVLSDKFERAQYLVSMYNPGFKVEVPRDFMTLSFTLHERKIDGADLDEEIKVLEQNLWKDLAVAVENQSWQEASVVIAKLKIIKRFKN